MQTHRHTQRHSHTGIPWGASDHRRLAMTEANWVHRPWQRDTSHPKDCGLMLMMHTLVSHHRLAGCWGPLVSAHLSTFPKHRYPETEVRDAQRQSALQRVEHACPLTPSSNWRVRATFHGFKGRDAAEERCHRPCQQPGIRTYRATVSVWGVQGPASLQLTLWPCHCQHFSDHAGAVMGTGVVSHQALGASRRKPASSSQRHHQLLSCFGSHPLCPA